LNKRKIEKEVLDGEKGIAPGIDEGLKWRNEEVEESK